MSNIKNTVAIVSVMAKLQNSAKEITQDMQSQIANVEKNAGTIQLQLDDEELQKSLGNLNELVEKKLKKLDLSKQFKEMLDVFSNPKSQLQDYLDVVKKVEQEFSVLHDVTKKYTNLNLLDSKGLAKIIKAQQKVNKEQKKFDEDFDKSKVDLNARSSSYKIKKSQIFNTAKSRGISVKGTDVAQRLNLQPYSASNQAGYQTGDALTLRDYGAAIELMKQLNEEKKKYAAISTTDDAEQLLRITQEMRSLQEHIRVKEAEINQKYGIENSALLSSTDLSHINPEDINLSYQSAFTFLRDQSEAILKEPLLKVTRELTDIVSTAFSQISEKAQESADIAQKKSEKVQKELDTNADKTHASDFGTKDTSKYAKYMVSLNEAIDQIFAFGDKLEEQLDSNNPNENLMSQYEQEQNKYFARIKALGVSYGISDDELRSEFVDAEIFDNLNNIYNSQDWTKNSQRAADYIMQATQAQKEQEEAARQATAAIVDGEQQQQSAAKSTVEAQEEKTEAMQQAQSAASDAHQEINKSQKTAGGSESTGTNLNPKQVEHFVEQLAKIGQSASTISQMNKALQKTDDILSSINLKLEDLSFSMLNKNIGYHAGNLDELFTTHKSESWSDRIDALQSGDFGAWGTGTYITKNLEDLPQRGKFYAVDLSKYNMYINHTAEQAEQLNTFLKSLEKFVLSSGEFRGFDEDIAGMNVDSLFKMAQSVFTDINLDIQVFTDFINQMKSLVAQSGIDTEGVYHLSNPDLEYSDSIPTRFMKSLGYQGVNNSGIPNYDNVEHGSVIYDLDTLDPYIKRFTDYNELLLFNKKILDSISLINPFKSIDLSQIDKLITLFSQLSTSSQHMDNTSVSVSQQEQEEINKLKTAINEVTKEIDTKTEAFKKEEQQVESSVKTEIENLEKLREKVNEIAKVLATPHSIEIDLTQARATLNQLITEVRNTKLPSIPMDVVAPANQASSKPKSVPKKRRKLKRTTASSSEKTSSNKKSTTTETKSATESAKQQAAAIDKVTAAYTHLAESQQAFIQLSQKAQMKTINADEILDLHRLTEARKEDLAIIRQATDLTEEQIKAKKLYESVQSYDPRNIEAVKYANKISGQIENGFGNGSKIGGFDTLLVQIEDEVRKLQAMLPIDFTDEQAVDRLNKQRAEIERLVQETKKAQYIVADPVRVQSAQASFENWVKNNSRAMGQFSQEIINIRDQFEKVVSVEDFSNVNKAVATLKTGIINAGKTGISFFDKWQLKMRDLVAYITTFVGFNDAINLLKQGYQVIKEYDSAMTNLYKVAQGTRQEIDAFGKSSYKVAAEIGATNTAVIDAATEWSRLGYSIQEAAELSKASTIYANVGEIDAATATTDLVSTMKAFDIEAANAMRIVDSLNEIGNNYAVSSAQLGQILEKSSSTLAVSGDSMDQVIAMGAAMNEIVQDAGVTGNTLKMLSLRIRGAKTDIED